jgi:hypothetical protein
MADDKPTGIAWRDVPNERMRIWNAIFHKSKAGMDLSDPCPICNDKSLHQYYMVGRPERQVFGKDVYVARGAGWQWCSSCGAFLHFSALVPDWWQNFELSYKPDLLTMFPEALEQARLRLIVQRED